MTTAVSMVVAISLVVPSALLAAALSSSSIPANADFVAFSRITLEPSSFPFKPSWLRRASCISGGRFLNGTAIWFSVSSGISAASTTPATFSSPSSTVAWRAARLVVVPSTVFICVFSVSLEIPSHSVIQAPCISVSLPSPMFLRTSQPSSEARPACSR